MKVLKTDAIPAEPANSPLFTGGPVTRQTLLTPEMSNNFNLAVVNFSAGARNKMHIHSSDQVLFVTAGKGIIATEAHQEVISVGDVVQLLLFLQPVQSAKLARSLSFSIRSSACLIQRCHFISPGESNPLRASSSGSGYNSRNGNVIEICF